VAEGPIELGELVPRFCDCEYCQQHPSAVVSNPNMVVLVKSKLSIYTAFNGSGQATFYHCNGCNQLLAVGAILGGVSQGAVNAFLFGDLSQFAEPTSIQPWRLSATEKAARWAKVWGRLKISHAQPSV
jgi:hypothetical protein